MVTPLLELLPHLDRLLYSWSIIALKRIMQTNLPKGEKGNPMLQSEHEQTSLVTNLKQVGLGYQLEKYQYIRFLLISDLSSISAPS